MDGSRVFQKRLLYLLVAAAIFFPLKSSGAEFVADLYEERTGAISSGRVFVKGPLMRRELQHAGIITVTVIDLDKGTAWILNSASRTFAEVPSEIGDHPLVLGRKWSELGDAETIGSEDINGRFCEIVRYEQEKTNEGPLIQWIDREMDFPIISKIPMRMFLLEYRNIIEMPVRQTAFEIPQDYRRVTLPGQ